MKKMLLILVLLFSIISINNLFASEINWLTIKEAEEKMKKDPRPVLIDIYTDWCGWCKELDKQTYADPIIAEFINEHFYAVKFNPEEEKTFTFNGTEYKASELEGRKYHEFELFVSDDPFSYPTTAFLNPTATSNLSIGGFLDKSKMHLLLSMITLGEDATDEQIANYVDKYTSPYDVEPFRKEEEETE